MHICIAINYNIYIYDEQYILVLQEIRYIYIYDNDNRLLVLNNKTIAVVNILFGNRPDASFEMNLKYCLQNKTKKLLLPFSH